ncbi:MAG: hypothetical protein A3A33_01280 [Candidatus Yanofskybacteria bacterium RIFCSPLOWO2_01_FULL_49_25]|uniref:DNA methylase N-4/N-6 domain-containing protein n=1 Tax=Candidatus Yanofskybacteria bacterium RIFCSPLOWO2_01_FULL_49_25 TaxID=1802701 RepID=A0A1F8GZ64_9BACT|nr:MAG: hypothetical protein A3A33_01280 [Candidatus Yanofskybacteria bacterium RIFCSPLOWO2_01_FULL_49_25]
MPSLNWIGKDKIENHDKEVAFRLLKKNEKLSLGKSSENLIVEGDNLEALKALMPHYAGQVKCIYIDPPYNTGNEGWVYNDKVNSPKIKEWLGKAVGPEGEDLTRHDKWLCMMYPRLKLLRDLLKKDGVIFISIDDNEHCYLKLMMDELFGPENFIESFIWKSRQGKGATSQTTAKLHEYVVTYAKDTSKLAFKTDKRFSNKDNKERLRQWGQGDSRKDRPTMYYPVFSKEFGEVFPKKPDGTDGRWRISRMSMDKLLESGSVFFEKQKDGRIEAYKTIPSGSETNTAYSSILDSEIVKTTAHGSVELKNLFGDSVFAYPKPSSLIQELLSLATFNDKKATILDSFAGSGTTAQAVLQLNKEDKGNRKFILVEIEEKIARTITSERVRRVAKDLGGDFEYVTLGDTLFESSGVINQKISFKDLASYIYFTETHTNINLKKIRENFIGEYSGQEYYLLLKDKDKNILNRASLSKLSKSKLPKIVYADKCLLDQSVLDKYRVIFKQIPYSVKTY